MAIKLIDKKYCPYSDEEVCEFICDTDSAFANLPTCYPGSTAASVSTGTIREL